MRNLFVIFISLFCYYSNSQDLHCYYNDNGRHERNRNIDVQYMKLQVSFVPEKGIVNGIVTHTFISLQNNIDTIYLDGPEIKIDSAFLDGKLIKTFANKTGIICNTNLQNDYKKIHNLRLKYSATPKRGIYFIGWNLTQINDPATQSRRQIWTQGQGIDNRHWIPMVDDRGDKFITEVFVTFNKEYNVLSNGQLLSEKLNKDNTKTWNYKINNPHVGYLLMLAIDKYAIKKTKTSRGTPINFWYYPEHPERLEPTSRYSERIIEFLEDETGIKYPWGSYSQVMIQDFLYGAMENTSATTFGDFFWTDNRGFLDRNYVTVNAHEATHQWFGDLITARNDGEHWLQESFATFYPGLFLGSIYGEDEKTWYFRGNMNGAIAAGEKDNLPVRHSEGGTARHYPKGASCLYMLQKVMGRDNFNRGIKLYLETYGFKNVETADLQKAMMDATGMNMDWFFDQWIYRGGEPIYKVSTQSTNNGTEFNIEQIHKTGNTVELFKMPIDCAVYYSDGSIDRKTFIVEKASHVFIIPNSANKKVLFTLFDEGSFVLKKVQFEKSFDAWSYQFAKAEKAIDRFDALQSLYKNFGFEKIQNLITTQIEKEKNKNILAEIAKIFAQQNNANLDILNKLYTSKHVEIRRAIIENAICDLNNYTLFEKALDDSSYGIIETAITKLWDVQTTNDKHAMYLQKIQGMNGHLHNLKIKYLELGSEHFADMGGNMIGQLIDYTTDLYEFRTRINSMQAIKRLGICNSQSIESLFKASLSFNGRLATPAKEVVNYFKEQTKNIRTMRSVLNKFNAEDKNKLKGMFGI